MTAKNAEQYLLDLLSNVSEDEDFETETFEDRGLLTLDRGIILYMPDGSEIHLTIQAF